MNALLADAGLPLHVLGAREATVCQGSAVPVSELEAVVAEAREALFQLDLEWAAPLLDTALDRLTCAPERLQPRLVSDLFFLRGLAAAYGEREQDAILAFAQSLAVDPDRSWDASYPPQVYLKYLAAMELHYNGAKVPVRVQGLSAWVDGRAVEGGLAELPVGYHYLQLEEESGVRALRFLVETGDAVLFAPPDEALGTVALGPSAPASLRPPLETALARLETASLLVSPGRAYRFEGGSWTVLREPPDRRTRTRRGATALSVAGGLTLGAGAGLLLGTGLGDTPHPVDPSYAPLYRANVAGRVVLALGGTLLAVGLPLAVAHRAEPRVELALAPGALALRGALP